MNIFYKKLIFLSVITLAAQSTLSGQVTIGSNNPPLDGSLLQLKENQGNNANSAKGIGMPRVSMVTTTPALGQLAQSIGSSDTWDEVAHMGLLVYNTNACVNGTGMDNGLYVWNGTQWESLRETTLSPDVQTLTDPRDNETYLYRSFGDAAGVWMLENMRYIDPSFTASTGNSNNNSADRFYAYPNANVATPGIAPSTWRKNQGLIYSYAAATLGAQDAVNTDQSEGRPNQGPLTPIQGVCPAGWHLPSDSEWNQLEKEIYNNPQKYSAYTSSDQFNPTTWNDTWNTTYNSRGSANGNGHGYAMLSPCLVPGATGGITTGGTSLPASQGGFDIKLVGRAGGAYAGSFDNYGNYTTIWSSSVNDSAIAWFRSFDRGSFADSPPYKVTRANSSRSYINSVRCKKND
ncbi:FISUMP domain-containing protein [Dysgonomonas sp. ZJ279]|uniref:FISUMP domain-containing protein n=1 Tax=Dysgonomonas sp. ZJ279 TaxID=2709796 RepID=UPI0013ED4F19|nr:FISUMP domain-containing protein [Dysgonomonas sp. ZJ279]